MEQTIEISAASLVLYGILALLVVLMLWYRKSLIPRLSQNEALESLEHLRMHGDQWYTTRHEITGTTYHMHELYGLVSQSAQDVTVQRPGKAGTVTIHRKADDGQLMQVYSGGSTGYFRARLTDDEALFEEALEMLK